MFLNCTSFEPKSLALWDVSSVAVLSQSFQNATSFTGKGLESWKTSNVLTMQLSFSGATRLDFDGSGWAVGKCSRFIGTFESASSFRGKGLEKWNTSSASSVAGAFWNAESVDFDASLWDVRKVSSMALLFTNATSFQGIGLQNWKTDSVVNLFGTFSGSMISDVDLSGWSVGKVTNFEFSFEGARQFQGNGLELWDTSNGTSMRAAFQFTSSLAADLSSWSVEKVSIFSTMFYNSSFNSDVSGWNVRAGCTFWEMFANSSFNQDLNNWRPQVTTESTCPTTKNFTDTFAGSGCPVQADPIPGDGAFCQPVKAPPPTSTPTAIPSAALSIKPFRAKACLRKTVKNEKCVCGRYTCCYNKMKGACFAQSVASNIKAGRFDSLAQKAFDQFCLKKKSSRIAGRCN